MNTVYAELPDWIQWFRFLLGWPKWSVIGSVLVLAVLGGLEKRRAQPNRNEP